MWRVDKKEQNKCLYISHKEVRLQLIPCYIPLICFFFHLQTKTWFLTKYTNTSTQRLKKWMKHAKQRKIEQELRGHVSYVTTSDRRNLLTAIFLINGKSNVQLQVKLCPSTIRVWKKKSMQISQASLLITTGKQAKWVVYIQKYIHPNGQLAFCWRLSIESIFLGCWQL